MRTKIVGGENNGAIVDYRMRQGEGGWRIIDVMIEGISLVANFRDQFREVLARGGPEALLQKLKEKNDAAARRPEMPAGVRGAQRELARRTIAGVRDHRSRRARQQLDAQSPTSRCVRATHARAASSDVPRRDARVEAARQRERDGARALEQSRCAPRGQPLASALRSGIVGAARLRFDRHARAPPSSDAEQVGVEHGERPRSVIAAEAARRAARARSGSARIQSARKP